MECVTSKGKQLIDKDRVIVESENQWMYVIEIKSQVQLSWEATVPILGR